MTAAFVALIICTPYVRSQSKGPESSEVTDPLLTAQMIAELPFVRPETSMQQALKLAEGALKKKVDINQYFLEEARLSYSQKEVIAPYWYFKWLRSGEKQGANLLEVTVSMKGKVSIPQMGK
jgi:hypothetical protein